MTYNGKVYVPVNELSESLGYVASFDPKTNKLTIGAKDNKVDLIKGKLFEKADGGSPTTDPDLLTVGNETFKSGFYVKVNNSLLLKSILLNTNKNYQKISFKAAVKVGAEPIKVVFQ
nr:stalk domain-containing protein [Cohnella abietis]